MPVARPKTWIVALVGALALLTIAAFTIVPPGHSFTGTITDSMCPLGDHSQLRRRRTDPDCARACVEMYGGFWVLYDGKKTTYLLSDQKTPEQFAATRVRVIGTLDAKTGTIQVESIQDSNIDSVAAGYLAVIAIFFIYQWSVERRIAHAEDEIQRLAKTE